MLKGRGKEKQYMCFLGISTSLHTHTHRRAKHLLDIQHQFTHKPTHHLSIHYLILLNCSPTIHPPIHLSKSYTWKTIRILTTLPYIILTRVDLSFTPRTRNLWNPWSSQRSNSSEPIWDREDCCRTLLWTPNDNYTSLEDSFISLNLWLIVEKLMLAPHEYGSTFYGPTWLKISRLALEGVDPIVALKSIPTNCIYFLATN